jgi:ribonuclease D
MTTEPELIADPTGFTALVDRLRRTPRIAFDTEAASFHRYVDRVYLVQLSTDHETVLVDPLAVDDLSGLGPVLADPDIEIVFHDADYDMRVLDRDYGFRVTRIFDTRLAAELAGEPGVGLGSLLQKHFGVVLNKRLQRADWSVRPLSAAMLAYAADDTRYLLPLRDLLSDRLRTLGRLGWLEEECARMETIRWTGARPDDEAPHLRLKGAKALSRRDTAVLEHVFAWRDATARALDRAPFRVLSNQGVLALARAKPRSRKDLTTVADVPRSVAQRYADAILQAIERGLAIPESELPVRKRARRMPPDPAYDARLERLKDLRNAAADRHELPPGLLCPNGTLQGIARLDPDAEVDLGAVVELRAWQRGLLGDDAVLAALRGNAGGEPSQKPR